MNKCVGCGIKLQSDDSSKDGFISSVDFNLCERCFKIKNYGEFKKTDRNNVDYMKIFDNIYDNQVVYVSSLLTLNLDYINNFNDVILVLTKRDIIPKSVKDSKIINYIKKRYNNIEDVIIVSAFKKKNLDYLYNKISKIDKDIYFVGSTNSGKSTLINELINSFGDRNSNITVSHFPSTTLDVIETKIGNVSVFDTPGIVNDDSIINVLSLKELKKINSKKEIKPITFQISGVGSIMVDNLFRLDYDTISSSLTFYMSNNLNIRSISLKNELFNDSKNVKSFSACNQDIVIENVGFIKITENVKVSIKYKNDISVVIRDNLI